VILIVVIGTYFLALIMELIVGEIFTQRLLLKAISMEYKADIFREFTKEVITYLYTELSGKVQNTEIFINQSLVNMEKYL
jgi:[ribosomal protein S5]-alanine N-acetyltransferase